MKSAWIKRAFRSGRSLWSLLLVAALLTAPCFGQGRPAGRYSNAVNWGAESSKITNALLISAGIVAGLFIIGGIASSFSKSPTISIDPSQLDFGKLSVGLTATREIKLINKGTRPLQVDPPTISGPGFSLANPWESSRILAKGEQTTIAVVFTRASNLKSSGWIKTTVLDTVKKRARQFTIGLAGK